MTIKTIKHVNSIDGTEFETVLIDHGNGEFTSMLKSTYEAQQAEHLTEIPPQAAISDAIHTDSN